jgi:lambda family phage minor tail protein L
MAVKEDIQSLSPSAMVELFVLDTTNLAGGAITRFHAGISGVQTNVWWQGNEYQALPVEASGFDVTAKGSLPRPHIKVANVSGLFSAAARDFDDLIGCKVTRKRTFAKYLDTRNFSAGNASADPNQYLPDELWFVERKVSENRYVVEWELASAFDLQGVMLPFRQVVQNSCQWTYRSAECGYTGGYMGFDDLPAFTADKDGCPKLYTSCKTRFATLGVNTLNFGGFPGAKRDL